MKRKILLITVLLLAFILLTATMALANTTSDENILEIKYEYNEDTNEVTAMIISKIELQDTKPTWKLSEDKKIYTKVFSSNMSYSTPVVDINGNVISANIEITQIQPAKITMDYIYDEATNEVTAMIISNVALQDTKPTWKLSEDKKTYTKVFSSNMSYSTPVVDMNGNTISANINVTLVKEFNIDLEYELNKTKGQVIAKIKSNIELKDTKPSWTLSEDKHTYTKVFNNNMVYETPFQDIFGRELMIKINIDQIGKEKPIIKMNYEYDEITNQVTAQIISDVPLEDTKPSWKLSEDRLIYTKVFTSNTSYSTPVQDIYGNIVNANINIKDVDMTPPEITLEYKYNDDDTVTVYMKSNKELEDTKITWKLSQDKKVYEKTFDEDQNYSTSVQNIFGISTSVKIDFKMRKYTYKQEDNSTIKVRYLYSDRKQAVVEIISSVKMIDTKPSWTLSEDGYKYTKIFYENQMYETAIQDVNGLIKNVNIMVNLFDNYLTGIDVSAHQGEINWSEVKNSGIDFAIIRCGYGQDFASQDDKYFARNIAECERLGIPYGIYLYSYALNVDNALSEADHVLRLIKGHNPELGIWYDLEDDSYKVSNGMPSNETFVDIAVAFCEKIKANGYSNVGIYANLDWWKNRINSPRLDVYAKWVAQWSNSCSYDKPYKMWQYTSKGSINGIEGNVDMDILYK